jgi:predicted methyltransferase
MWIGLDKLRKVIKEVVSEPYATEGKRLKDELEDLKLKKRIEEAEIKHLVKMKEEKNAIELEKQVVAMQKEFAEKEMTLLKKYQQDLTGRFIEEQKNLQAVYAEIMKRLPNVNMEIERKSRG